MNAVLIATGSQPADTSGNYDDLPELRRLVGRPWIEHVVEQLAQRGIAHFCVILCESPERLREILGNGERWGVSMDFQSVKDARHPYGRIQRMAQGFENSPFLLAHANRLPDFSGIESFEDISKTTPLRFDSAPSESGENPETDDTPLFTGYALLTPGDLHDWTDEMDEDALETRLTEHTSERVSRKGAGIVLSSNAPAELASVERRFSACRTRQAPFSPSPAVSAGEGEKGIIPQHTEYQSLAPPTQGRRGHETPFRRGSSEETPRRLLPRLLDARSARGLLAANLAVLRKDYPGILMKNNEVQNGVWISRNVMIHPTSQLAPPLYIGEDCRIERQVYLGPGVVVEPQCVIDRKASVQHSMIHRHSYVGENLEVNESIIDRNRLINTRLDTAVSISESFLLGSLSKNLKPTLWHLLPSKAAALLLLLLLLPLQLLALGAALLRCPKKPFRSQEFLDLPAHAKEAEWETSSMLFFNFDAKQAGGQSPARICNGRDFLQVFLPGLWSVVLGRMHLVGLPARPPAAVRELPEDWRNLYLKGKVGLITQNMVLHDGSKLPDDKYAAETFYVATASFQHDFRLFAGYARKVVTSLFKRTPNPEKPT